jgi:hypothetical protein
VGRNGRITNGGCVGNLHDHHDRSKRNTKAGSRPDARYAQTGSLRKDCRTTNERKGKAEIRIPPSLFFLKIYSCSFPAKKGTLALKRKTAFAFDLTIPRGDV